MVQKPQLTELLESGVHFGHHTKRWNPKMAQYIYTQKNDIHIIDLSQTLTQLDVALQFLNDISSKGRVLVVGTKRQAHDIIESEAQRAGEFYVVNRWVGGLLTNFQVTQDSIKKMLSLDQMLSTGMVENRTKRELLLMRRDLQRLQRLYWGIKDMNVLPQALIVIDPHQEKIAVKEANALGIPIVAIVDTNCDPELVTYPVPGNDDAINSISLFMRIFVDQILEGKKEHVKVKAQLDKKEKGEKNG